jgi:hypothetical protein
VSTTYDRADVCGWTPDTDLTAAPPVTLERVERRANGNVVVTITGAAADVDAAVAAFFGAWPWAYSPRVDSRTVLADGRAVARLFRFANC